MLNEKTMCRMFKLRQMFKIILPLGEKINFITLSALVKKTRREQNLTQDLAAACGIGVRYIVDLEKAKKYLKGLNNCQFTSL